MRPGAFFVCFISINTDAKPVNPKNNKPPTNNFNPSGKNVSIFIISENNARLKYKVATKKIVAVITPKVLLFHKKRIPKGINNAIATGLTIAAVKDQ